MVLPAPLDPLELQVQPVQQDRLDPVVGAVQPEHRVRRGRLARRDQAAPVVPEVRWALAVPPVQTVQAEQPDPRAPAQPGRRARKDPAALPGYRVRAEQPDPEVWRAKWHHGSARTWRRDRCNGT
jgi:hypothetical protein